MGEVPAREDRTKPNLAIQQSATQVCFSASLINSYKMFVSKHPQFLTGCTDHSTTGNCDTLLTLLAEMNDTALVQTMCENSLGSTLCQRTCHDIFYEYGIDGTFC